MTALCYRLRIAARRRLCGLAGHDPSWVKGIALGYVDRPVCADCGQVLPAQRVPPGVSR